MYVCIYTHIYILFSKNLLSFLVFTFFFFFFFLQESPLGVLLNFSSRCKLGAGGLCLLLLRAKQRRA